MSDLTTSSTRQEQAVGLRAALDLLEQHPDLPTPMISAYDSGSVEVDWFIHRSDEQREAMVSIRRAIGGAWDKVDAGSFFILRSDREGFRLSITADREQVCERVVIGSETVTVPAVEAQPERTEVRDVIEWRCEPIGPVSA